MQPSPNSRRQFVKQTATALGMITLPDILQANPGKKSAAKRIVCVGGHPDDPESGCGGTLAKLSAAGHDVTIIYLTAGEAGIPGKSHSEAAVIRKQEAINACKILNARPVFAGQIDGDTIVNNEWISKMLQLVEDEKPDLVLHTGRLIRIRTTRPPVYLPYKPGCGQSNSFLFIFLKFAQAAKR